jgi:hypothetical protein
MRLYESIKTAENNLRVDRLAPVQRATSYPRWVSTPNVAVPHSLQPKIVSPLGSNTIVATTLCALKIDYTTPL